jgi:hypothetical protein
MFHGMFFFQKQNLKCSWVFKGGKTNENEKDCADGFIVGFDFGVGRVPLVASSWRRPWWRPLP